MAQHEPACVVGRGMRVNGTIAGQGNVEVRGSVHGRVALQHHLWVAAGGEVEAEVEAHDATLDGRLAGRVRLGGGAHVRAGAQLSCDLHTPSLVLSEEAHFDGQLDMPVALPPELGA